MQDKHIAYILQSKTLVFCFITKLFCYVKEELLKMDTKSFGYLIAAAEDMNFTKTAKKLYISQQDLSNHIARLEKEFNCRIFERKPKLALTYAGQCVLDFARNYDFNESNIRHILSDLHASEIGQLNIGCSPHRTGIAIPVLAEKFHTLYPNVQLNFYSAPSDALLEMLLSGKLDCALAIEKYYHPNIENTVIFEDDIYLMVSRTLLSQYSFQQIPNDNSPIDLTDFKELPFINIKSSKLEKNIFECYRITPSFPISITDASYLITGFFESIAASIVTRFTYLHIKDHVSDDILFLPIKQPAALSFHDISFIHNRKKYFTKYAAAFEQLAKQYFQDIAAG